MASYFFLNISTKGKKIKIQYIPVYRKGFLIYLLLDIYPKYEIRSSVLKPQMIIRKAPKTSNNQFCYFTFIIPKELNVINMYEMH